MRSSFQVFSPVSAEPTRHVAQDYTSRDIKLANIISQKKRMIDQRDHPYNAKNLQSVPDMDCRFF